AGGRCAVQSCAVRRNGRSPATGGELENAENIRNSPSFQEISATSANKAQPTGTPSSVRAMATVKDSAVIVRRTQRDDLPEVIAMIQELADFEKMPDGPQLTVDDLIRDGGFDGRQSVDGDGGAPVFHSFVLEATADADDPDGPANQEQLQTSMPDPASKPARPLTRKLIGYAICYYSYSTWQGKSLALEDIYIRPAYRGNGYGELFFRALAKHAKESRCSRVDFHVLNWNPATKFYRRMGALDLTEAESWHFYRLQKDAIDRLLADDRQ
uniref:N-acetyltransferase domain-containing protein n=1 Tax=Anopheles quadriannulatus TaxID=34691 RepID=A0A182X389_ANOQN